MTEYAKRDARALEPYYNRHVSAMTHERLDAKSDIAAELAWRDKLIAELTARAMGLDVQIARMREALNGIAQADWRTWEELASPKEFVRWAMATPTSTRRRKRWPNGKRTS